MEIGGLIGVYAIKEIAGSHLYIGSTTLGFEKRWNEHQRLLRANRHPNHHLQAAWNKYGESNFCFDVLEVVGDILHALAAEQAWLDKYWLSGLLYNQARFADSPMRGRKHSQETKKRLSEIRFGKRRSPEACLAMKQACRGRVIPARTRQRQLEVVGKAYPALRNRNTGHVINAGQNISKLCRDNELIQSCMSRVISGERVSHRGWEVA